MIQMNLSSERSCSAPPSGQDQRDSRVNPRHSRNIPLPSSHITRTQSELQLSEAVAAAEWQDLCMFYRVVRGIRERQQPHRSDGVPMNADPCELGDKKAPLHFTRADFATMNSAKVTPFESSSEHSPLGHDRHAHNDVARLPQSAQFGVPSRQDESGWSITGFDEELPQAQSRPAIVEEEDICEDEVFHMDL